MKQRIRPQRTWIETTLVIAISVFITAGAAIGIDFRRDDDIGNELLSWEIDAFKTFNDNEIRIYEDMTTMAEDITMIHESNGIWPDKEALEEEGLILSNLSEWSTLNYKKPEGHGAIYRHDEGDRSFILLIDHNHEGANLEVHDRRKEIWCGSAEDIVPKNPTETKLASKGWRRAVGITGANERHRINGGTL